MGGEQARRVGGMTQRQAGAWGGGGGGEMGGRAPPLHPSPRPKEEVGFTPHPSRGFPGFPRGGAGAGVVSRSLSYVRRPGKVWGALAVGLCPDLSMQDGLWTCLDSFRLCICVSSTAEQLWAPESGCKAWGAPPGRNFARTWGRTRWWLVNPGCGEQLWAVALPPSPSPPSFFASPPASVTENIWGCPLDPFHMLTAPHCTNKLLSPNPA